MNSYEKVYTLLVETDREPTLPHLPREEDKEKIETREKRLNLQTKLSGKLLVPLKRFLRRTKGKNK